MNKATPGKKFRRALKEENPLQIIGTINAYCALMAKNVGYRAIYLSGAGCANASYGLPDLAITSLDNVLEDARRITSAVDLPLLVDIDTGWGSELNITRTIQQMTYAGVAAVHIEDQLSPKRCGHRSGKKIVPVEEMVARIRAAVAAKIDPDFFIIARTDAVANEGIESAIKRAQAYSEAGADGIFAEAITELKDFQTFAQSITVPLLANMTEFGQTPLLTMDELKQAGVKIILYPLTAMRAMNQAALNVYETIRNDGTQKNIIDKLQNREILYHFLNYHHYENLLK